MGTAKQLEFVSDIEVGVSALIAEDVPVKQVNQVLDRAGYKTADLAPYVHRLTMNGDWELIDRLSTAFLRVQLVPVCIVRALQNSPKSKAVLKLSDIDSEALKLDSSIPDTKPEEKPAKLPLEAFLGRPSQQPRPVETSSGPKALSQVMAILEPLNKQDQKKVIGTAMAWFEVGG